MKELKKEAIELLIQLIKLTSFSGEEKETADLIEFFLRNRGIPTERLHNNIIARNKYFDKAKKTIILNSHHDTVKVNSGWTINPFGAKLDNGKLFGLGSNDAGASLVALISTFVHFYSSEIGYNLVLVASGEEENSGVNGIASVLKQLEFIPALAIIGEPTEMHLAVAEKGLIVIDAKITGESGHAAREVGKNSIYMACNDIRWLQTYTFPKISEVLGKVKMTVTEIHAGTQHNVIPDSCEYVIDVRVNELYRNEEVIKVIQNNCEAEIVPRSLRWQASGISKDHPIVVKGLKVGRRIFGSPTLSDQVHFSCPSIKIGPGESERSHTADEFIELREIEEGIDIYINILDKLNI